jgi:glycosyltransferase involved in cell wall biosynthesis
MLSDIPQIDVSFVVTTYNYDKYLSQCIDSCLNQTNTTLKYEVIIIDDGSNDSTSIILNTYKNSLLRSYKIENSGVEFASNYGFNLARGNFIVRVDADDYLSELFLSIIEPYLEIGCKFFYGNYSIVDQSNILVSKINLPPFDIREVYARGDFLATGTVYPKSLVRELEGYSCNIKNCGLENYDFILRSISKNFFGLHIPENIFYYRRHESNISKENIEKIITNGKNMFRDKSYGEYTINNNHPY